MVISLLDKNDEPPRFTQKDWYVEVDEEFGQHQRNSFNNIALNNHSSRSILILSVRDADLPSTNHFRYKIIAAHYSTKFERITPNNYSLNENELQANFEDVFQIVVTHHNETSRVDVEQNNKIASQAELRMLKALDYEIPEHKFVLLKILVTDMFGSWESVPPYHLDVAFVHIKLRDVNDNPPRLVNQTLPPIIEGSRPGKVGHIYAVDSDDYARGNGPPFTFYIDPSASERIKRLFRLEVDHNGDGHATLYTTTVLDREQQKEYHVPIVVRDSGYPPMSSTCMATVIVGDVNDNDMADGWKAVVVYIVERPGDMIRLVFII